MPKQALEPEVSSNGPLRRLIRDEDLPDEVGPDSPFRHYPKYQVHKLVVFDSSFFSSRNRNIFYECCFRVKYFSRFQLSLSFIRIIF